MSASTRAAIPVIVACMALLSACAGERAGSRPALSSKPPPDAGFGSPVGDAQAIADAIAGRVVVAGFTNPLHGEGVAEIVYYRRDGAGFVYRFAAREPALHRFAWQVRTQPSTQGPGYAFIASDGRDDGAAVTFAPDRQRLTFSDIRYGPYFSFGVLQDCWPGFMPLRPPNIAVCDAGTDAAMLRRLENEQAAVARLRATAQARAPRLQAGTATPMRGGIGAFTTRPGAIYTNDLGNTLTVTGVDGRRVTFRNQTGAEFVSHALLYANNPRVLGNEAVIAAIDRLWPLAVGKRAEAWVFNADWQWKLEWVVTRREMVTVPAGTFEAWLIEHTETSMGDGYIARSQTWYAPAIGWNVRFRGWVETDPRAPATEWVLTGAQPIRS